MRYLVTETSWTMIALARALEETGTLITSVEAADLLDSYLGTGASDLILLDESTLAQNGLSLGEVCRMAGPAPVVLAVTGPRPQEVSAWLGAGATDVLDLGSSQDEIGARLGAVARRAHGLATPVLRHGGLVIDLHHRRALACEVALPLSPKVYAILEYIALRPGQLITRDALLAHVYGFEDEPDGRVLDVYVCTLRSHLARWPSHARIETVRGAGFRFVAQAASATARAA